MICTFSSGYGVAPLILITLTYELDFPLDICYSPYLLHGLSIIWGYYSRPSDEVSYPTVSSFSL